ncbi:thrombospondin type-1 domain-containing protein 7A-like [Diadema antillarum]|uniref:thrombospondin type-1 domain-containing protein 7A-like n=1 Tax=Diadema antillarum TaxID=105358 RepID=UPI003A83A230
MDHTLSYRSTMSVIRVFIHLLIFFFGPRNRDFVGAQKTPQAGSPTVNSTTHDTPTSILPTSIPFEWAASPWTACGSSQNKTFCGQTRAVFCVYVDEKLDDERTRVPYHYCSGLSRPSSYQKCAICPEDCVLDSWIAWSEWSGTCKPAARYRSRVVVRSPRFGGRECGELSQAQKNLKLPDCTVELSLPSYKWRIGEWTSCRQPSSAAPESCMVGQRYRRVDCVDVNGEISDEDHCLQSGTPVSENSLQTANFRPASREICTVPCDCLVSLWSDWSECSMTCHDTSQPEVRGHRTRSRRVIRAASNGGVPCPPLTDHQPCEDRNMTICPQYVWFLQDWQECHLTGNSSEACGAGIATRQVFCMENGSSPLSLHEDSTCQESGSASRFKPVASRACYKDCPVDCEVGHWSHWSPCTKSCGEGAVQIRSREVLVETVFGGAECPSLVEVRECENIECARWHKGRWSTCFLDFGYDDCGPGTRNRAVYCISARNEHLTASYCAGNPKPVRQGTCRVPCAEECVVSEWSDWGSCSVSCGTSGGVQKRSRRIVAYPFNRQLNPCLPEDQLTQTKPCNLYVSCHTYSWQATPWSDCSTNGTLVCGEGAGTQRREVVCEMETGEVVSEQQCDAGSKPDLERVCDWPCPTDCQLSPWSSWSSCSASCGLHARRTRTKHVLTLSVNGGRPCPPEADANGLIMEYSPCPDIDPCYAYQWVTTSWTGCSVVGSNCGRGLQTREVYCGRSDGLEAEDGLCLQDFTQPPPSPTQRCYIPCGGDCLLSAWSEYGPCQANCGAESGRGYCRMRKREIVGVGPRDNPRQLCPHIADSDLHEFQSCNSNKAIYSWSYGPWTSCVLPAGLKCGNGRQNRGALCERNDGTQVADLFCLAGETDQVLPTETRACKVQCSVDCEVTIWSNWSSCSEPCGQGERTRTRTSTVSPIQGGRACPLLAETQMCFERSCDQLEWDLSEWNPCVPTDLQTNCGTGKQTRTVTCPAGNDALCQQRAPKPADSQSCPLPCQGDCVFSEWSAFTTCSSPCSSGQKSRTRIVVRPNAELQPCLPLRQTVPCTEVDCAGATYRLRLGEWSQCRAVVGDCGRGTRHRTLNCVNLAGEIVGMDQCQHENVTTHESCLVECPVDCQLGEFTPWSECSQTCGTSGIVVRTRKIVTHSSGTGRRCQEVHNLNETKPCNVKPCYTYRWFRGNWSSCQFDSKAGCGVGEQTRLVECQRSDGLTVDWEYCYLNGNEGSLEGWNQLGLHPNQTSLDLDTHRRCEVWCPGDCVVSEWSQFTPCLKNCFNDTLGGQRTRTRVVISPPVLGGKPCTTHLIDSRPCPAQEAKCPLFRWMTGEWDSSTRSRDVWCEMEGKETDVLIVQGGCDESLRPPSSMDCVPDCSSVGSYCDDGRCHCANGFTGTGRTCYPAVGCVMDSHCPFPHTVCSKERECTCRKGYYAIDGMLKCVPVNTPTSTSSDGLITDQHDSNASPFLGRKGTWKWIVVAVCVGVVILAAIIAGVFIYRYYHTGEVHFEPIPHSVLHQRGFPLTFKRNGFRDTKC